MTTGSVARCQQVCGVTIVPIQRSILLGFPNVVRGGIGRSFSSNRN